MGIWTLGWPELPPDIYLPENSQAEQKCPACGGNDGDMPCAYPGEHEQQPGCLRAARLPPNMMYTPSGVQPGHSE